MVSHVYGSGSWNRGMLPALRCRAPEEKDGRKHLYVERLRLFLWSERIHHEQA